MPLTKHEKRVARRIGIGILAATAFTSAVDLYGLRTSDESLTYSKNPLNIVAHPIAEVIDFGLDVGDAAKNIDPSDLIPSADPTAFQNTGK
ncbi:MAG TPA: hypothetical protein VF575_05200 [Candidatus Saccharimonadales bacterium]